MSAEWRCKCCLEMVAKYSVEFSACEISVNKLFELSGGSVGLFDVFVSDEAYANKFIDTFVRMYRDVAYRKPLILGGYNYEPEIIPNDPISNLCLLATRKLVAGDISAYVRFPWELDKFADIFGLFRKISCLDDTDYEVDRFITIAAIQLLGLSNASRLNGNVKFLRELELAIREGDGWSEDEFRRRFVKQNPKIGYLLYSDDRDLVKKSRKRWGEPIVYVLASNAVDCDAACRYFDFQRKKILDDMSGHWGSGHCVEHVNINDRLHIVYSIINPERRLVLFDVEDVFFKAGRFRF